MDKDYLTKERLGEALSLIFPYAEIQKEVEVPDSRCRWDFVLGTTARMSSGGFEFEIPRTLVVEFDGHQHYTQSEVQERDRLKDMKARALGYKVIRWPYWLQVCRQSVEHFFKVSKGWKQSYPHGFIDGKAVLPADFNSAGVERFIIELDCLPLVLREMVLNSLQLKAEEIGHARVYPSTDSRYW